MNDNPLSSDGLKSYKDYIPLAKRAERISGLPDGLLVSILVNGERTDPHLISSAGARGPAQIIPSTAEAIKKKYGIDAYASPESHMEAAAAILKENLHRNKGDAFAAVREYHGGVNPKNWGPVTRDYVKRVMKPLTNTDDGREDSDEIYVIEDVDRDGHEPDGAPQATNTDDGREDSDEIYVIEDVDRDYVREDVDRDGHGPDGAPQEEEEEEEKSLFEGVANFVTGKDRETKITKNAHDVRYSPQFRNYVETGNVGKEPSVLNYLIPNPVALTRKLMPSGKFMDYLENNKNVDIRRDSKGNRYFVDGETFYSEQPGLNFPDVVQALPQAAIGAMTGGGAAAAAAVGAGVQSAIQAGHVASGTPFSLGSVLAEGVTPFALKGVSSLASKVLKGKGVTPSASEKGRKIKVSAAENINELQEAMRSADYERVAMTMAPSKEVADAARRLNIELPEGMGAEDLGRQVGAAIESNPLAGTAKEPASRRIVNQLNEEVHEQLSTTGGKIAKASRNAVIAEDEAIKELYETLSKQIGDEVSVLDRSSGLKFERLHKVPNIINYIEQEAVRAGGLDKAPKEVRLLRSAVNDNGKATYYGLEVFRQDVGEAIKGNASDVYRSIGQDRLRKTYAIVSKAQENILNQHGRSDLVQQLSEAKKRFFEHARRKKTLVQYFGKELSKEGVSKLNTLVSRAASGNLQDLKELNRALPEDQHKAFGSFVVKSLVSGGQSDRHTLSYFVKNYGKIKNDSEVYNTFKGVVGSERMDMLDDFYVLGEAAQHFNADKIYTGRLTEVMKTLLNSSVSRVSKTVPVPLRDTFASAVSGIAERAPYGIWTDLANAIAGPDVNRTIGAYLRFFASKEFREAYRAASGGPIYRAPKEAARMFSSKAFRDAVNEDATLTEKIVWKLIAESVGDGIKSAEYHR